MSYPSKSHQQAEIIVSTLPKDMRAKFNKSFLVAYVAQVKALNKLYRVSEDICATQGAMNELFAHVMERTK
jgi:hypothetical protein